jgi:DNA-binding NarL/FixJ family response regulator
MWIRIRVVIIEDEPLAAQYLAGLLDDTCQVEVVGTAAELRPAGLRQALLSNRACRVSFVNLP